MHKRRVIAVLVLRKDIVVQSIGFKEYLPVGRPEIAARFFDRWGADEIVMVDTCATPQGRTIKPALVQQVSDQIRTPFTVGGGITGIDDVRLMLQSGADKVLINRSCVTNLKEVSEAARIFGSQCIIASIDAKLVGPNYEVFIDSGKLRTRRDPATFARELSSAGIGEIILNSIDLDGTGTGFDLNLTNEVTDSITTPVVALGGAGHPQHFVDAFCNPRLSGAAAANFFHYTEHAITIVKAFLKKHSHRIRLDSSLKYSESEFLSSGRIAKKDNAKLETQLFGPVKDLIP